MDNSEGKCAQVRPLLKAGQVWIDRSGDAVTIYDCPSLCWDRHRYPYLGFVARDTPLRAYNENGWRVNENDSGPSYLVRLYVDDKNQPALDPNKPVQLKKDHSIQGRITYGPTKRGVLLIELPDDDIVGNVEDWENIPEPKRTGSLELIALRSDWAAEGSQIGVYFDNGLPQSSETLGMATATYTEGEGWSIEEIKS